MIAGENRQTIHRPTRTSLLYKSFVGGTSPSTRLLRATALAMIVIAAMVSLSNAVASLATGAIRSRDFLQEYVLARAITDGFNPYMSLEKLAEQMGGLGAGAVLGHPTNHPPTAGLLMLPIALFSYQDASVVWLAVELGCLLTAACLLLILADRQPTVPRISLVFLLLLAWGPTGNDLAYGQVMIPILTLLCGSLISSKRGRPGLAGILLAVAIALKPIPAPLLLVFAFRREWRALGSSLGTLAIAYLASGLVYGWDRLAFWATSVLPSTSAIYRGFAWNQSLWSVGWRLFDGTNVVHLGTGVLVGFTAPPVLSSYPAAVILSVTLPVVALAATILAAWKSRDRDASFSLFVIASILVSPISWIHYLVLVSIPIAWLFRRMSDQGFPDVETTWSCSAIAASVVPLPIWAAVALVLAGKAVPVLPSTTVPIEVQLAVPTAISFLSLVPVAEIGALFVLIARIDRHSRARLNDVDSVERIQELGFDYSSASATSEPFHDCSVSSPHQSPKRNARIIS